MTFDDLDGRHSHLALDPFDEGFRAETIADGGRPVQIEMDADDEPTTEFLVMEVGYDTHVGPAPAPWRR
jgi:hypothetical protein